MSKCNGSSSGSESDPESSATDLAKSLLLTGDDVPGFEAQQPEFDFDNGAAAEVARWAGVPFEPVAQEYSKRFSGQEPPGAHLWLVSCVHVFADSEAADRVLGCFEVPGILDQVVAGVAQALDGAGVHAAVSMSRMPAMGERIVAMRSAVELDGEPIQFTDSLLFGCGSAVVTLAAYSVGAPPSPAFERQVADALIARADRLI